MSEYKENTNFEEGVKKAAGGGGIDLGGDDVVMEFDPFADETSASVEQPAVKEKPAATPQVTPDPQSADMLAEKDVEPSSEDDDGDTSKSAKTSENPFDAAIAASETKQAEATKEGLIGKPPVFEYAAAKEVIADTSKTFEELRAEKAADFPELEEASRVSWKVTYGKTVKAVSDPKGTSIAKIKTDIEQSKEFLDGLKKTKGEVECKVTPTVTAQKKGEMPVPMSYRGIYTNLEDAENSGKPICLVPSDDGNVYEIRNNEIGRFVTKARTTKGLSSIRAGFTPALLPIPYDIICQVITFFRTFMNAENITEALVNVYWDKEREIYCPHAPVQTVSKALVETVPPDIDTDRFLHVADIHSHNTMAAKFSSTDDDDEKAARIYMVIGRLHQLLPDIAVRVAGGGGFVEIDPASVIEFDGRSFPDEWLKNVSVAEKRADNV